MRRALTPVGKNAPMTTPSNLEGGDDDVTLDPDVTIDPATPVETSEDGKGRVRGVVAGVLGVLAILVLTVTAIAVWATRTVFDSEKVAGIVGDALAEPDVQTALADYVTTQVFNAVDVDAVLTDVLPDQLQRFEPVLAAGASTAVERGLSRVLANPDVQNLLEPVVERAHARAMDLLEGDGLVDGITVVDGAVTLNTLPLIGRGIEQVQQLGLLTNLDVPELSADGDPDDQIAALSEATGRDLPDDFGQLVVYQSDELADAQASVQNAQRLFAFAKRAVWLLVGLSIVLLVATILVARRRWRATFFLGLGGLAAMVIVRSATRRVVDDAPELAARPGGRAAIESIVGGASTGLLRLAGILLIIAVAAAVVALYRRGWRRDDLILATAVVVGVAIVAVAEVSIVTLIVGIVAGVLVVVFGQRKFGARPAPRMA